MGNISSYLLQSADTTGGGASCAIQQETLTIKGTATNEKAYLQATSGGEE